MKHLKIPTTNPDYFLLKRIMEEQAKKNAIEKNGIKNEAPNFTNTSKSIDLYFITNKLRLYCGFLSYDQMSFRGNLELSLPTFLFIPTILNLVEQVDFKSPTINAYYSLIQLLNQERSLNSQDKISSITKIELILSDNPVRIHPEDQLYLYSILATFCSKQINLGKRQLLKKCFRYNNNIINIRYDTLKDKEYYFPVAIFKNIIFLALNLKDDKDLFRNIQTYRLKGEEDLGFESAFEWVKLFIQKYKHELHPRDRNVYAKYCLAYSYFKQENFTKAYLLISTITKAGRDIDTKVNIKLFFLMCAYEESMVDSKKLRVIQNFFSQKIDAYRKQVSTREVKSGLTYLFYYHKEFIKLFQKLYKFKKKYQYSFYERKSDKFKHEKHSLFIEIETSQYPIKTWLLEKLNEIK